MNTYLSSGTEIGGYFTYEGSGVHSAEDNTGDIHKAQTLSTQKVLKQLQLKIVFLCRRSMKIHFIVENCSDKKELDADG